MARAYTRFERSCCCHCQLSTGSIRFVHSTIVITPPSLQGSWVWETRRATSVFKTNAKLLSGWETISLHLGEILKQLLSLVMMLEEFQLDCTCYHLDPKVSCSTENTYSIRDNPHLLPFLQISFDRHHQCRELKSPTIHSLANQHSPTTIRSNWDDISDALKLFLRMYGIASSLDPLMISFEPLLQYPLSEHSNNSDQINECIQIQSIFIHANYRWRECNHKSPLGIEQYSHRRSTLSISCSIFDWNECSGWNWGLNSYRNLSQKSIQVILEDRYLAEYNQFNNVDEEYMKSFALEYSFRHNYTMNKEAIAEAIISRYTFWPDRANEWMKREKFIELTTDCYYTAPIALSAHLHSAAGSRTFMYVNNYNFSRDNDALRFIPSWMG